MTRRRNGSTAGMIRRVPNQPKTPIRTFRVPDELWNAAKAKAQAEGTDLSRMLRDCLEKFLRAKPKQRKDKP